MGNSTNISTIIASRQAIGVPKPDCLQWIVQPGGLDEVLLHVPSIITSKSQYRTKLCTMHIHVHKQPTKAEI